MERRSKDQDRNHNRQNNRWRPNHSRRRNHHGRNHTTNGCRSNSRQNSHYTNKSYNNHTNSKRQVQIQNRPHNANDRPRSGHSNSSGPDENSSLNLAEKFKNLFRARFEGTMRLYDKSKRAVSTAITKILAGQQTITDILDKNYKIKQKQWEYYDETSMSKYRGYFSLVELFAKRNFLKPTNLVKYNNNIVSFEDAINFLPREYKVAVEGVESAQKERQKAEQELEVAQQQFLQLREMRNLEELAQAIHEALSHDRQQFQLSASSNHNHKSDHYTPYQLYQAIHSNRKTKAIRDNTKVYRVGESPSQSQTAETVVNNWQSSFANLIAKLVYIPLYDKFQELNYKNDISDLKQKIWACKGDGFKGRYSLYQFLNCVADENNPTWTLTSAIFHESQTSGEFCGIQVFSAVAFALSEKALGYYRDDRVVGGLQIFYKGAGCQKINKHVKEQLISSLLNSDCVRDVVLDMLEESFEKSILQNGHDQNQSHAVSERVQNVEPNLQVECREQQDSASKRVVTLLNADNMQHTEPVQKLPNFCSDKCSGENKKRPKSAQTRIVSFIETEQITNTNLVQNNVSQDCSQLRVDVSNITEDSKSGQKRPASCTATLCGSQKRQKLSSECKQDQNDSCQLNDDETDEQFQSIYSTNLIQQQQIADIKNQRYQMDTGPGNILKGDVCIDQIQYDKFHQNGRCHLRQSQCQSRNKEEDHCDQSYFRRKSEEQEEQCTYLNREDVKYQSSQDSYNFKNGYTKGNLYLNDCKQSSRQDSQEYYTNSDRLFLLSIQGIRESQQLTSKSNFNVLDTGQQQLQQQNNKQIGIGPPYPQPHTSQQQGKSCQQCENLQCTHEMVRNFNYCGQKQQKNQSQTELCNQQVQTGNINQQNIGISNSYQQINSLNGQLVESCTQNDALQQRQVAQISSGNDALNNSTQLNYQTELKDNDLIIVQQVLELLVSGCCDTFDHSEQQIQTDQTTQEQRCSDSKQVSQIKTLQEMQRSQEQQQQDINSNYLLLFNTDIIDDQQNFQATNLSQQNIHNPQMKKVSDSSLSKFSNEEDDQKIKQQSEVKEVIEEQHGDCKFKRTQDLSGSSLRSVATLIFLKDSSCCVDEDQDQEQEQEQEYLQKNFVEQQKLQTPIKNQKFQQIEKDQQYSDEEKDIVEYIRQGTGQSTSADNNAKPQKQQQQLCRKQQKPLSKQNNEEEFCQLVVSPPMDPRFQCNFLELQNPQPLNCQVQQDNSQLQNKDLGGEFLTLQKGQGQGQGQGQGYSSFGKNNFVLGGQTRKTPDSALRVGVMKGDRDMMAHVRPCSGRSQSYRDFLDEADPVYQQYLQGTLENAGVYSLLDTDVQGVAELGLDLYGDRLTCSEFGNDGNLNQDVEGVDARDFSPVCQFKRLQQQMVPLGNLQRSTSLQVHEPTAKVDLIQKAQSLDSSKFDQIQSLSFDTNNIPEPVQTISLETNKLDQISNLSIEVDKMSEDLNIDRAFSAAPSLKVQSSSWSMSSAESDTSSDYDFSEEMEFQKNWRMQHRTCFTKAKKMDGTYSKRKQKGQDRSERKKLKFGLVEESENEEECFQFEFDEDFIPLKVISIPQGPIQLIPPTFYSSLPLHPQFLAYPYRYYYTSSPLKDLAPPPPSPPAQPPFPPTAICLRDTSSPSKQPNIDDVGPNPQGESNLVQNARPHPSSVSTPTPTPTSTSMSSPQKEDTPKPIRSPNPTPVPALTHVPPIAPIISPPPRLVKEDIQSVKIPPIVNPPNNFVFSAACETAKQNDTTSKLETDPSKNSTIPQLQQQHQQQESKIQINQEDQISNQSLTNQQILQNQNKETSSSQSQQQFQAEDVVKSQAATKNGFVKNGRNVRQRTLSQAHLEALRKGRERKRTQKIQNRENLNNIKSKSKQKNANLEIDDKSAENSSEEEKPILSKQDSLEKIIENKKLSKIQKIRAQVILESSEDEQINLPQNQSPQKKQSLKQLLQKIDGKVQTKTQRQKQDGKQRKLKHKKLRAKSTRLHKTIIVREEDNIQQPLKNGKTQLPEQKQDSGTNDEEIAWKLHHELNEAQLQRRVRERSQRTQIDSKQPQIKDQNSRHQAKTLRQQNALTKQQQIQQQQPAKQNSVIQSLTNGYTRKNTTDYAIFGIQKLDHSKHIPTDVVKLEQVKSNVSKQPVKSLRNDFSKTEVQSNINSSNSQSMKTLVQRIPSQQQQQQQWQSQSRPQSPLIKKGNRIIIESSDDEEKEKGLEKQQEHEMEIIVPKKEHVHAVIPKVVSLKRYQRCSSDSDDEEDIEKYKKMKFMCTSEYAEQHSKQRKHSARSKHAAARTKGSRSSIEGGKIPKKRPRFVKQEGEVVSNMSVADIRRLKASTIKKLPQQAGRQLVKLSDLSRPCSAEIKTNKQSRNQQTGFKLNGNQYQGKKLSFGKSVVHAWGLFADEDISKGDFVIEYIGELIRSPLADVREKYYESQGNMSSYFFRLDKEWVVDAMEVGGLARFINHSCDPNCHTKIVKQEQTGEKTKAIAIFALRDIAKGEELFYDYKFPEEDMKLVCNCGAKNCRGFLN